MVRATAASIRNRPRQGRVAFLRGGGVLASCPEFSAPSKRWDPASMHFLGRATNLHGRLLLFDALGMNSAN